MATGQNNHTSTEINRRNLLAAASAMAAVGAAPVAALAETGSATDPHPSWLREWRSAKALWSSITNEILDENPESEAAWDRAMELEELIYSTPAATIEGVATQLTYVMEDAKGPEGFIDIGHGEAVQTALQALTSGAVTLAAPLAPMAAAATETPVMVLFREWLLLEQEEQRICDLADLQDDDPRLDVVAKQKLAVMDRLKTARKETLADLAICLIADTEFGLFGLTDGDGWMEYRAEARALVGA